MNRSLMRALAAAAMAMWVAGCVTPTWTTTSDGSYTDPKGKYSVTLPNGWSWVKMKADSPLLVTRDGPGLQAIRVYFREHDEAFPYIEEESSASIAPYDLARLFVADVQAEHGSGAVELLGNEPVEFGGKPGFRVELAWRNEKGLRYQAIAYGCATGDGLYLMMYQAPVLNYYARHVDEFEQTVSSFRLPV